MEVAKCGIHNTEYLFGPTINFCTKMNVKASENGIIIGNDLYNVLKKFPKIQRVFHFENAGQYFAGFGKYAYPLYRVSRKMLENPYSENKISSL